MRVAVLNRGADHPGGDLVHIAELSRALEFYPYNVSRSHRSFPDRPVALTQYHLAHVQHINFDWCRPNFRAC